MNNLKNCEKKLKQNCKNIFDIDISIGGESIQNPIFSIDYVISSDKKFYYKISCDNIQCGENLFDKDYVEGVRGFKQHIVSNEKFHMVFNEKNNRLELITWNNSIFVYGKLV